MADSTDEKAIHSAAEDLGKTLGDAAVVLAKVKQEVKANAKLTDEQVKQIKSLHETTSSSKRRIPGIAPLVTSRCRSLRCSLV